MLFKTPRRFSIDIDILLQDDRNLESYLQKIIQQGTFIRYEESRRAGELPKAHYKFFFQSVIQNKESQILLDILFEKNPYPALQQLPLETPLLAVEGEPVKVTCPAAECLLGDKLTAFAPHTTGIQYGLNAIPQKSLWMAPRDLTPDPSPERCFSALERGPGGEVGLASEFCGIAKRLFRRPLRNPDLHPRNPTEQGL